MTKPNTIKAQLLEYYMAHNHTEFTNTVIKVLSCTDPEIENSLEAHEELNVIVAIPRQQNLRVDIIDPEEPHMEESSAQGESRRPPSGTTYDRPRPPPRRHETTYQSGPVGGSYRSGTSRFQRINVPEDYIPEKKFSMDILSIDCTSVDDRKLRIQAWHHSMRLIISTDNNMSQDFELAHILMQNKSIGIANDAITGINKDEFMRGTCEDFLQNVVNMLYLCFLGTNYLNDGENQTRLKQEKARARLTKLQICDLCFLDQFTCDYEKNLFSIPNEEWIGYIEDYLRKIPYIGPLCLKEYQDLPPVSKLSVMAAKNMVQERLTKVCTDRMLAKRTKKINLCCPEFQGPETMYGCQTIPQLKKWKKKLKKKYRFKKPKKKHYYKSPKKFRKYFGHPKRKKRFFKRNSKGLNEEPQELGKKDKPKFCPQQKKSCKCWICQQVGHMSYECPNKGSNKDQAKVFEEIIEAYNLAPLEEAFSDVSSDEDLYYLETSSSESEYDSSTDTDSTDQE
jgi:hypothetical protein